MVLSPRDHSPGKVVFPMTQEERLRFLLHALLAERPGGQDIAIPRRPGDRRRLLRALMNTRPPDPIPPAVLAVQDAFLQAELAEKNITRLADLTPRQPGRYLWQGDITTLAVDAIVNAANSQMLGCFVPCHGCIDNAIHSAAGMELRQACAQLMARQGHEEPTGQAKLTPGYHLPCRYVLHTVGPIITGPVTGRDQALLASCYRACLALAEAHGLASVAFCCISTGEFHFPNDLAAQIAVDTVSAWQRDHPQAPAVVFNVFKDEDRALYEALLR